MSPDELLPFVFIVILLLIPDMSELAIPGVLSLKRRLSQQEAQQELLKDRLATLEQNVTQQVETNIYAAYPPDMQEVLDTISSKLDSRADGISHSTPPSRSQAGTDSARHAQLVVELLTVWERLVPYVMPVSIARRGRAADWAVGANLGDEQFVSIARWNTVFAEEIQAVRAARNEAAHRPWAVSDGTLEQAIDAAETLLRILEEDSGLPPLDRMP